MALKSNISLLKVLFPLLLIINITINITDSFAQSPKDIHPNPPALGPAIASGAFVGMFWGGFSKFAGFSSKINKRVALVTGVLRALSSYGVQKQQWQYQVDMSHRNYFKKQNLPRSNSQSYSQSSSRSSFNDDDEYGKSSSY